MHDKSHNDKKERWKVMNSQAHLPEDMSNQDERGKEDKKHKWGVGFSRYAGLESHFQVA